MFYTLSLKKLFIRPTETLVCVIAFGLGMSSLAVCWSLLSYTFEQTKIFENSLAVRSYIVTPAQFDFNSMFSAGYIKAGTNVKQGKPFNNSDLELFRQQLQGLAQVFFSEERLTAPDGSDNVAPASIFEVSPNYFKTVELKLKLGRQITNQEYLQTSPALLVTDSFAKSKFGDKDPIGRKLMFVLASDGVVRRIVLTIVGVFRDPGCQASFDGSFCGNGTVGITPFGVFANTAKNIGVVSPLGFSSGVLEILKRYVKIQNTGLSVKNLGAQLKRTREESNSRAVISLLFAFGGLVAAALTMGNLMYGWVNARRQLIGVTKALGARRYQIVLEYLIPASAIAVVGAVLGFGFTFAFLITIRSWVGVTLPLEFPTLGLLYCFLVTSVTALCAASIPSFLAASISPIEALRA